MADDSFWVEKCNKELGKRKPEKNYGGGNNRRDE